MEGTGSRDALEWTKVESVKSSLSQGWSELLLEAEEVLVEVIPPGMDFSSVVVQKDPPETDGGLATLIGVDSPKSMPPIWFEALNNGLLVDPHDYNQIIDALLRLVVDKNLWKQMHC